MNMDTKNNNNSLQTSQSSEYDLSYHSIEQETNEAKTGKSLWRSLAPKYKDRLYNHILKTADMKVVVSDLLNSYNLNNDKAVKDMLQFFLDIASYQHINLHSYLENHEITDIIPHMENSPSSIIKETGKYLLQIRNKTFLPKLTKIEDFVVILIYACASNKILYDFNLIAKCLAFLKEMSSSNVRAIRHTGVFIVLKFQSGFIRQASKITKKIQDYQDQMVKEINPDAGNTLEKKILDLQNRNDKITKLINFLHKNVYAENCHMLDSQLFIMRKDCIAEIINWIEYFPERYLQNNCIVYITKAVSDPNKTVRFCALQYLSSILIKYHVELQQKFSKYISTIAERIKDIDYKVAILAIDTLNKISKISKMPNFVRDIILLRVYSNHYPLAAACARFLINILKTHSSNHDDVEMLKQLINFQVLSNQQNKITGMYPMLIEAVIDYMPMLQDINVYLAFLDIAEMNEDIKDVFLNILIESVSQTYKGCSSIKRKYSRVDNVDKDKNALLTTKLLAALPRLTELFSLDALKPLLDVIKKHR